MSQHNPFSPVRFLVKILQGSLIGLGAVLPGISGGVLCVIFGIYQTIMEFLADPLHTFKTHVPKLLPIGIGGAIGYGSRPGYDSAAVSFSSLQVFSSISSNRVKAHRASFKFSLAIRLV